MQYKFKIQAQTGKPVEDVEEELQRRKILKEMRKREIRGINTASSSKEKLY